ncbi:MAG: HlyD family efflux transporter periplasmic adaptor subunit [Candidatus Levybacteria bacterium]|nr:HlyD family efflux transporter periplasmic adaptor subunit [Candidatus Levybacteria bacterium]
MNKFIKTTINKVVKKVKNSLSLSKKKVSPFYKRFIIFSKRKPITAFLMLLAVLFSLIVLSNLINRPVPEVEEAGLTTKDVSVYTIGTSPKIKVQAQVEKSGVIKIVSLGSGVVQGINVFVGQQIYRGTNLISMSTNYQGGNAFSLQRQLAQTQYKNVLDTYQAQKDLIGKQKELANKNDENADELRRIGRESLDDTRGLINLNNDILNTLSFNQSQYEATNSGGMNDALVLQMKQLRSQLLAGNNQLELALRNSEYSTSDDEVLANLSDLGKDIAIRQLDLQEKALDLNKEVSRLNVMLAQVNEALMFPSSPVNGVVERIYVRVGQVLTPGMPIAQVTGDKSSLTATAFLSREIAGSLSQAEMSTLYFGSKTYEEAPFYVSKEATDGSLYSAQFSIPDEFASEISDKGYITIDIPIGFPKTGSAVPFVPLDSIFQTQDQAFVYVAKDQKAQSKKVILGQVFGRFVEIESGLLPSDQVIIDRNVIEGDPVRIVKN